MSGALLSTCPTCRAVFRGGFQRCPNDGSRLQESDEDPLVGTVLAGRYQIEAVLGDGGIGRVYRARHVRMSRKFAIKVPFGELAYDRKVRARFANEAEAASRLSHPNVIGVVDVGETPEGLFYLAMDLAEGIPLCDLIARGRLDEKRALRITAQIADGLAHAHDRGLVHRDLKPDNVILGHGSDGDELARIVDFGLAIVERERSGNRLTTEGVVLGTPHYMAPEQATDEEIDYRADLFALGLILFEMLAGTLPFDGNAIEVARQNLSRELPTVSERAQVPIDPLIEALVSWLTRKYARERPEKTVQVAEIARMILRGDRDAAAVCIPGAVPAPVDVELVPLDVEEGVITPVPMPGLPPSRTPTPAPMARPGKVAPAPVAPPPQAMPFDPTPEHIETQRMAVQARRRRILGAIALLVLLIGGMFAIRQLGLEDDARTPVVVIDASATPVAVIELDAAAIDAMALVEVAIDAAVVAAPIDAGRRDGVVRPQPPKRVDAGVPGPGTATGPGTGPGPGTGTGTSPGTGTGSAIVAPPPVDDAAEKATLRALYEQVGQKLERARVAVGADRTDALRRRYAGIPYLEAIRKASLRSEALAQLRALSRELDALK